MFSFIPLIVYGPTGLESESFFDIFLDNSSNLFLLYLITFIFIYSMFLKKFSKSHSFINYMILFLQQGLFFVILLLSLDYSLFATSSYYYSLSFFFNKDPLIIVFKIFIIFITLALFHTSINYFKHANIKIFEYPILILFSVLAIFFLLSSTDFFTTYLSLELLSFCFYILASLKRYSNLSIEAALKYFSLGSFSSIIFLFGVSLVYGYFGTLHFFEIYTLLSVTDGVIKFNNFFFFGLIFILVGLLFKLAIFPFHYWIADVYEGAPTVVTAYFATIPKIVFLVVFVKIYFAICVQFFYLFSNVLLVVGVLSIIISFFLSMYELKIKRFLAFSAIGHLGYIFVILSIFSVFSLEVFFIYLFVYIISSLNIFAILLIFRTNKTFYELKNMFELPLVSNSNTLLGLIFSLMFLSIAGIPPFAGFFSKFYIFYFLIEFENYFVAGIVILMSIISSIYYIS